MTFFSLDLNLFLPNPPTFAYDPYYVYALKSETRNYIYIGLTNNVERRFGEHNAGYNKTTKPYRPFRLIYTKTFSTRPEARVYEKHLKTSTGRRFLRKLLLENDL